MAYVSPDFKTKKELRAAVANGKRLEPYTPGGYFGCPQNGEVTIEGPHYPRPHSWYARVKVVDGIVTRVLS
jgi:predicted RNA-binding Zn-ribbon protein involved in translation (DUF1610 family)